MIAGSLVEKLILSVPWLSDRQWSEWKILTISILVLFLLVWITKRQRSRKVRSKYKDQFLENSPVIGMRWNVHNKSNHISKDLKKDLLAPLHKHQKKQHIQTKEPLEKPHEESKQLQHEINTHKQAKELSKQQVSELKADYEKLQRELANLEKLNEEIEQLRNEISTYKQAKKRSKQHISKLTADNEKFQREFTKLEKAESQIAEMTATYRELQTEEARVEQISEQQVSELKPYNEKLQRELAKPEKQHEESKQFQCEINTHKQTKESSKQQVSELTADNEKLQREITKLEKAESQIAEMTAAYRQPQTEEPHVEQIPEQQIVAKPTIEVPVKRKTARRNKTYNHQHRTVDGVRQKLCRKCNEWKPESEFHKNSSSRDNLAGSCKMCTNSAARERRKQETAQR